MITLNKSLDEYSFKLNQLPMKFQIQSLEKYYSLYVVRYLLWINNIALLYELNEKIVVVVRVMWSKCTDVANFKVILPFQVVLYITTKKTFLRDLLCINLQN